MHSEWRSATPPDSGAQDARSRASVRSSAPSLNRPAASREMTSSQLRWAIAAGLVGVTTPPIPFHISSALPTAGSGVARTRAGRSKERSSAAPAAEAKKADGANRCALRTPIPPHLSGRLAWFHTDDDISMLSSEDNAALS